jgi:hypothetical protein
VKEVAAQVIDDIRDSHEKPAPKRRRVAKR